MISNGVPSYAQPAGYDPYHQSSHTSFHGPGSFVNASPQYYPGEHAQFTPSHAQFTPSQAQSNAYFRTPPENYPGGGAMSSFVNTSATGHALNSNDNFKVVIRVRPPLPREQEEFTPFMSIVNITTDSKGVSIMEYLGAEVNEGEKQRDIAENPHLCVWHHFAFDYVYDQLSTQAFVYDNTARSAVISVLEGYNATVLAYGQTGTGKTHTMEGFKYSGCDPQRGIVPRSMEEIFKYIETSSNRNTTFMVRASYL